MKTTKNCNSIHKVASTELVRHFSDYLAQVRYGNRSIIIEKNSSPVAEIRPLQAGECTLNDFLVLWKNLPSDTDFGDDMERVNHSDRCLENPWD